MTSAATAVIVPMHTGLPNSPNSHTITVDANPTCCERISKWFETFQHRFDHSTVGRLYYKTIVLSPLISNVFTCISSLANGQFYTKLRDLIWGVRDVVDGGSKQFDWIFRAIQCSKIFALTVLPLALFSAGKAAYDMIITEEKIDALLIMIESLGWFSESSSYFVNGLQAIGTIGSAATSWAFQLSILGAMLASATLFLNIKQSFQGAKLLLEIEKLGDRPAAILEKIAKSSDYALNLHFGIWGEDIREKITGEGANDHSQEKASALKDRIKARNFSYALAISSAAITCVALPIILLTTWFTLGYGCLLIASVISMAKFGIEYRETNKLKRALGIPED